MDDDISSSRYTWSMESSYKEYFHGKRITLVGLGLLGRGVGDARFLASQGADLIVTDLRKEEDLKESLNALAEFPNIKYTLGTHDIADFQNRDLIINGAGVPLDSPYIAEARKQRIPITMSTALFARFARASNVPIVGVTGTRGKSTTTHLIAAILMQARKQVLLGGNVQGVSTLELLPELTKDSIAVLELDSWQLQGFREEQLSPDIAVFTTFYPDHLNYYHHDMEAYLSDKAEIFLHQRPEDTLVLGAQVAELIQAKYGTRIHAHCSIASSKDIPSSWHLALPGEHSRSNVACAVAAARALHIPESDIQAACETFRGVSGRLELLGELNGVSVYNDTTATTPEATIAGLTALDPEKQKSIVLIMGGADKGLAMDALLQAIPEHCKAVLLLAGTGTDTIRTQIPGASVYSALAEAFTAARSIAQPGDTILFSPAFASFGLFKNEYDRGEQFTTLFQHAV